MEGGGYARGRGAQKIGGRKRMGKCNSIQFSIVGQTATNGHRPLSLKENPFLWTQFSYRNIETHISDVARTDSHH